MSIRILAVVMALALAACAPFSLVPANERITLGNGLSVQPGEAWSALTTTNEPNLRIWTMDGPLLNTMAFVPGVENGGSILKSQPGKEPMPVFRSGMGPSEVAELFEATIAKSIQGGSIVKTSGLRPAPFGDKQGFRFDFTLVNQADEVERKGVAAGTVHNGRLYLIYFHGARMHYFPKRAQEVERVIASARIG